MRIGLYLPSLEGGGIERLYLGLARQWIERGHLVELALNERRGELLGDVPHGVRIVDLGVRRQAASVPALIRYLRASRPNVVMAGHDHNNIMLCAAAFARTGRTRIVASQHNTLSANDTRGAKFGPVPLLYRALFGQADAIVAVSSGVADDLAETCHLPRERIDVIHNGIVPDDLDARMAAPVDASLYPDGVPTIVAMGRMVEQKDFATLLTAFARVRQSRPARLVILGDGPLRPALEAQAHDLGISADVAMPGFVDTPFAHLARASLFVLSSLHEGFGNVVAEALACGTPVVSTDCKHGPAEILEGGRYGILAPVADPAAMASAIGDALDRSWDREELRQRGASFSEAAGAARYLELFRRIAQRGVSEQTRKEVA
ncbi:MAG: glycosyltransferase [Rhizobiaceae bacterium]|nr:glycosyltransferase [Rhizobiaceae bacterium]